MKATLATVLLLTASTARADDFARAGNYEAGGSVGLMLATKFRALNVMPSIGWFIADRLELSAIAGFSNLATDARSATLWTAIAEPAYHVALNATTFGFIGMGVGGAYEHTLGTSLEIAPRLGIKVRVGCSGVLTPALQYQFLTHAPAPGADATTLALTSMVTINVGYTASW